jgi:tRNA pseudouridine65 synthase/23S rRNA pseudouridine1911/1915/1917 synthase
MAAIEDTSTILSHRSWESDWKQLQESQHVQEPGLYSFYWESSLSLKKALIEIRTGENIFLHHDLPFRVDDDIVRSSQYSRLILLPEHCDVCVTSIEMSHETNGLSRWKLQWIRQADTLPTKCITCTICRRAFATITAVQTHVQQVHQPIQMNPIYQRPLRIIYNDDALAVIDKPQGIPVQGDKETLWKSDLLLPLASVATKDPNVFRKPRPVHRLDSATGGLLVVAKTRSAEVKLREAFATCQCQKRYRALVWGACRSGGICEEPIQGRHAKTEYKPVQVIPIHPRGEDKSICLPDTCVTVIDLWPETGRKHQIRKHLQGLKHPIVGDSRYGGGKPQPDPYGSKLCLWAMEINFSHPVSGGTVHCQLENPDWLERLVRSAQGETLEMA